MRVHHVDPPLRESLTGIESQLARLATAARLALTGTRATVAPLERAAFRQVCVAPPVVVDDAFRSLEPHALTHHHMQVTRSGPVLLAVGHVAAHEHVDRLIAAYHVLVSHHLPDAKLVVVGRSLSHHYSFALNRQIRELNLPGAWIEFPESSYGVVRPGPDVLEPFHPVR